MPFEIICISSSTIQKRIIEKIEKCNEFTGRFGLCLSRDDAALLAETQDKSLKNSGRIEFGDGVIDKLIWEFCDSPYISMHNYTEILHELIEIFYDYKNETLDLISDEELIKLMKISFDGICQGSTELLSGRELAKAAHNLRYGYPLEYSPDFKSSREGEQEDGEY